MSFVFVIKLLFSYTYVGLDYKLKEEKFRFKLRLMYGKILLS